MFLQLDISVLQHRRKAVVLIETASSWMHGWKLLHSLISRQSLDRFLSWSQPWVQSLEGVVWGLPSSASGTPATSQVEFWSLYVFFSRPWWCLYWRVGVAQLCAFDRMDRPPSKPGRTLQAFWKNGSSRILHQRQYFSARHVPWTEVSITVTSVTAKGWLRHDSSIAFGRYCTGLKAQPHRMTAQKWRLGGEYHVVPSTVGGWPRHGISSLWCAMFLNNEAPKRLDGPLDTSDLKHSCGRRNWHRWQRYPLSLHSSLATGLINSIHHTSFVNLQV